RAGGRRATGTCSIRSARRRSDVTLGTKGGFMLGLQPAGKTCSIAGLAVAVTVTVALTLTRPAYAQKHKKPPTPAESDAAREHYQRGLTHYNLGEFDAAVNEFKQAYALSSAPGLLFNIA